MSDEAIQDAPRRGPLLWTVVIVGLLVLLAVIASRVATDYLWFRSIDFATVFTTRLAAQIGLLVVFGALLFAVVFFSARIAYRLRPKVRRANLDSEFLVQLRDVLDERSGLLMAVPAALLGVLGGLSALGMTEVFLAWWNRTPFGRRDPYFGLDAGFYVFTLPWLQFVVGYLMFAFIAGGIFALGVHFMTGSLNSVALRRVGNSPVSVGAQRQLSLMLGIVMLLIGANTLLDRVALSVSDNTLFTGVNYSDSTSRMPIGLILAAICFICAAACFLNVWRVRWSVPGASIALLIVSTLLLSMLYPFLIQSFVVAPDEPDKERDYISSNIEATRFAFGIDKVEIEDYEATTTVSAGQLRADAEALPAIRLIDPTIVPRTFEQLQQVRGYYTFPEALDVDRYVIDGKETDVVVAAREMNLSGLPDQNWNNIHTVYTHGYGLVIAYGNRRQTMGEPQWIVRDIPPVGQLGEHESRIYFGEQSTQYAIVGREEGQEPIELDTPNGRSNVYAGKGGVHIGNIFNRMLFAARFTDFNLMLSDRVNSQSRILFDRTPKERVQKVAPWLTVDSNIYPAVVDGRTVWIVDAYTTSKSFPNSQLVNLRNSAADTQSRAVGTQVDENINYIRNSVKAVVDAYDGTVTLYAWDEQDPILQAYSRAFPGSVQPKAAISKDLLSHLRYPEDLFKVQREILGRYHMTNPYTWYAQSDLWQVPNDPVKANESKEPPYYLSIKWPGDEQPVFSQTTVFVPRGRSNLASYFAVVAEATSPDYGKLRVLRMSDTHQIDGPGQTFNAINQDQRVAEMLRPFLNQGASSATYGNLLTLPMGNGLLYVAPVYTQRQGNTGSYPALAFVVVRFGAHVGIGATLQDALDKVFAGNAGADTGEQPTGSPSPTTGSSGSPSPTTTARPQTTSPEAAAQLAKAQAAFEAADAALRKGDLATYQAKVNEAKAALAEALKMMGR